jgi:hypothetical protein
MSYKLYNINNGVKRVKTKVDFSKSLMVLLIPKAPIALFATLKGAFADTQIIVTPTNTQGWTTADTNSGGSANIIADNTAPGNPKEGALQLTTDATTTSKAQYMHTANTKLSNVNELSYSTKQNSASFVSGDASYQLPVCLGGVTDENPCVGFTTFVYEPYQNGGVVTPAVWQSWDVASGQFWSSHDYSAGNCVVGAGGGGAPFYTLSQLKTLCPNATVAGFGVNVGSNNPSYNVEADLVNFNGTTYNFEPDTITVTIDKFVNGAQATPSSANNSAFPMHSSWSASNIGTGSGSYALSPNGFNSPNAYEAVTSNMSLGANYSTNEVTTGPTVSTTCTPGGTPYALVGYTTGSTLAAAQQATPSSTIPAFTSLQANQYVIVWNKSCTTPTSKDQCKDGGWKNFNAPVFKNQGDCVSWTEHNVYDHGSPAKNQ